MCKHCGDTTSKDTAPLSQGCDAVPEKKYFCGDGLAMAARFRRHLDGALPKNDKDGSRHEKRVKIRWLRRRHSLDFQITWFVTDGLLLWRSVKDKIYRQRRSLELQELRKCAFKATAFVRFHLLNRKCHEVLARCQWQPRNLWNPYLIFAKKVWNVKLYFERKCITYY